MDFVHIFYINCLLSQPNWQCSCDLFCGNTSNLFQIRSTCGIKMRCCTYFSSIFVIGECNFRVWISKKTSLNSITDCGFKFYYNGSVVRMRSPSPKHRSHTRVLSSIMGMDAKFYSDSANLQLLENHLWILMFYSGGIQRRYGSHTSWEGWKMFSRTPSTMNRSKHCSTWTIASNRLKKV